MFSRDWFKEYRRKYLYDASEEEIQACKVDRHLALGTGCFMIPMSIAAAVGCGWGFFEEIKTKTPWLFMAGVVFFCISSGYLSRSWWHTLTYEGDIFSYEKCRELRSELEMRRTLEEVRNRRQAKQEEEERQRREEAEERFREQQERRDREERTRAREESPPSSVVQIYYMVLGLDREHATRKSIEQAFRMAAIESHPDKNKDDPFAERRFKLMKEAYEFLIMVQRDPLSGGERRPRSSP